MNITKRAELRKLVWNLLSERNNEPLPRELIFNRGIDFPKYKITIEELVEDFFIDSKGQKWARVKEEFDEIDPKFIITHSCK